MASNKKRWIAGAISHPGSFRSAAKKAGKSTHELAEEKKHASGKIGKRARLALTFEKMRHKKKDGGMAEGKKSHNRADRRSR